MKVGEKTEVLAGRVLRTDWGGHSADGSSSKKAEDFGLAGFPLLSYPPRSLRAAVLNLSVLTPLRVDWPFHRVAYQISCMSDICIIIHKFQITVMK